MPRFVPVSPEPHRGKKWLRPKNFGFAAKDALVAIDGSEIARAARAVPIAFVSQGGRYALVAMFSLTPGRNLFVGADGRWTGGYIPTSLRAYPFRLLAKGDGNAALLIDEESGLLVDGGAGGEDFFDATGALAPALKPVIELMTQAERYRRTTESAVAALAQAGVIAPWTFTVEVGTGPREVGGLHRIDEAALAGLPGDAFLELRAANALAVAYAQLLSMGQVELLQQRERAQAQQGQPAAALPRSLDRFFGLAEDEGVLRFD